MLLVEGLLLLATTVGLVDGPLHGAGHLVRIENGTAIHVPRRAADGLDQGAVRTQEAFLVRIQNGHQGHFRHIQPLTQQVDAHQHVKLAQPQVADDLHPLHGVDVRVQIAHLDAVLVQVLGQILSHALGERGDQHPLLLSDGFLGLAQQVIHLGNGWTDFDLRIHQTGGTHHLLHHLAGVFFLVRAGRGGDKHHLGGQPLPFLELEGPVIHGRGQPEAEAHQGFLARTVALVHGPQLGDGHVGLIGDKQGILRQVIKQGRRRLAGGPAGKQPGIVLHPVAVAQLLQHLDVETGALFQPLGFHQLVLFLELRQSFGELLLDHLNGLEHGFPRGHIMALGVDGNPPYPLDHLTGQRVENADGFHLVIEQFDANRFFFLFRRENIDHIPAHPVSGTAEIHLVAGVLQLRQAAQQLALVDAITAHQVQHHGVIAGRVTQAVDGGHSGHDNGVRPLQNGLGGRQPHLLDLLVHRRVLLDKGVGARHIGFRLVVVVIGNEVLHRIFREELLELPVQLGRQRLVGRHDDGGPPGLLDHIGHGEGLAGPGHPEQGLVAQTIVDPFDQLGDSLGLVAGGLVVGVKLEKAFGHEDILMAASRTRKAAKSWFKNRHLV